MFEEIDGAFGERQTNDGGGVIVALPVTYRGFPRENTEYLSEGKNDAGRGVGGHWRELRRCNFGLGGGQIIRPTPTTSGRRVRQNAADRSCLHLSSARDTFAINASANLAKPFGSPVFS
jgi:hypothetical protein